MTACAQSGVQTELWIYTSTGELTEILNYHADGTIIIESD
jgi:hypothetical protein